MKTLLVSMALLSALAFAEDPKPAATPAPAAVAPAPVAATPAPRKMWVLPEQRTPTAEEKFAEKALIDQRNKEYDEARAKQDTADALDRIARALENRR